MCTSFVQWYLNDAVDELEQPWLFSVYFWKLTWPIEHSKHFPIVFLYDCVCFRFAWNQQSHPLSHQGQFKKLESRQSSLNSTTSFTHVIPSFFAPSFYSCFYPKLRPCPLLPLKPSPSHCIIPWSLLHHHHSVPLPTILFFIFSGFLGFFYTGKHFGPTTVAC